jgi:hypothetical protein
MLANGAPDRIRIRQIQPVSVKSNHFPQCRERALQLPTHLTVLSCE